MVSWIVEGFFFLSMVQEFFVSFENPNVKGVQIKAVEQIALRYVKGEFLQDLIPLIPLQAFELPHHLERLFYVVKVMRLVVGLKEAKVQNVVNVAYDF